jgi:hypothetical protein
MTDKGTYLRYIERRFNPASLARLGTANQIIAEYEEAGLTLTLRQLYYQFVARGLLPNSQQSYDSLGALISDGRLAGLISWTAIEDRTRNLRGVETYNGLSDLLKASIDGYRRDLWADQPWRPEVWIEKDALVGVISSICVELRVDFFACRGYNSQSEQWRAGQRFASYVQKGQRPIVFHLGDHDPSGLDMTRDNRDRLTMFAGVPVTVARLALNYDQVQRYNPPPNPTKMSDVRAPGYVEEFGSQSWELDALDPKVIRDLIRDAIEKVRDEALWSAALAREAADRDRLDRIIEDIDL